MLVGQGKLQLFNIKLRLTNKEGIILNDHEIFIDTNHSVTIKL